MVQEQLWLEKQFFQAMASWLAEQCAAPSDLQLEQALIQATLFAQLRLNLA
jgi:threonine aldolase